MKSAYVKIEIQQAESVGRDDSHFETLSNFEPLIMIRTKAKKMNIVIFLNW